jgi:hypothetical protein
MRTVVQAIPGVPLGWVIPGDPTAGLSQRIEKGVAAIHAADRVDRKAHLHPFARPFGGRIPVPL